MTKHFLFIFFFSISLLFGEHSLTVVSLSIGDTYTEMVRPGLEKTRAYTKRYGYDYVVGSKKEDPSRHIYWNKIALLQKVLEESTSDWIVWIDADTLIMNQAIKLESFIDDDFNLIISEDFGGINAGIMFFKNCDWTKTFLENVYNRTDLLEHFLPEQEAIAQEIRKNQENQSLTKIVPQRLFNAYCSELLRSPNPKAQFQTGDFLLHFASGNYNASLTLKDLFNTYINDGIDDPTKPTLDQFLSYYGFELNPEHSNKNEGYISELQMQSYKELLLHMPHIESVAEIGLNGGHSASVFFTTCPNLRQFTSFDIMHHPYTHAAKEYYKTFYKEIFELIEGNSRQTVPEYVQMYPGKTFDLIYVDGDHSYEGCYLDVKNMSQLAHSNTILLVDDFNGAQIQKALYDLENEGIIKIEEVHHNRDEKSYRCWVEARYL